MRPPVALSVAGSDSGGGAGIVADAATFRAHGVWPAVAVTAVTAQDTVGVHAVEVVRPDVVAAQVEAVCHDLRPAAVKTGMLGTAAVVEAVAAALAAAGAGSAMPLVVDPVLCSTSGAALLEPKAVALLVERLLPLAALVTPNLAEAAALTGLAVDDRAGMAAAATAILAMGPSAVLVTGGHLPGAVVADCLVTGAGARWFTGRRIEAAGSHGTGCVLSAAVTARLARGETLEDAVAGARRFVRRAIRDGVSLGAGPGAVRP
ncbi:MAG TPA: bifunctional hydroxymethylpyrimidine kinase/phosphomethylpyrimidine kinase [Acidimicrobiales bacterium]|nr:bifunctional hydroxymethylpyrimidine kinase/phosphomethylpyrimidine kinase [Acidimicrobiales bacterium]